MTEEPSDDARRRWLKFGSHSRQAQRALASLAPVQWVGINRNNLQLTVGADGNEFKGTVKSSNRDLHDNVLNTGSSPLAGKRIQVQPF